MMASNKKVHKKKNENDKIQHWDPRVQKTSTYNVLFCSDFAITIVHMHHMCKYVWFICNAHIVLIVQWLQA